MHVSDRISMVATTWVLTVMVAVCGMWDVKLAGTWCVMVMVLS